MPRLPEEPPHLLDLSSPAVIALVKDGKERGYVTFVALNRVLPETPISTAQIDATMHFWSTLGITVTDE